MDNIVIFRFEIYKEYFGGIRMFFNKSFIKKVSVATAFTLVISSVPVTDIFASGEENNGSDYLLLNDETTLNIDNENVSDFLSEEALAEDFDLSVEAEEIQSLQDMTEEQRENFDTIVEELIAEDGHDEEVEVLLKESLYDFFDENSETFSNLNEAQDQVEEEVLNIENQEEASNILTSLFVTESAHAFQARLGVKFVGYTINALIAVTVGGSAVAAVRAFIVAKGKKEAQRMFTKTVKSRLIAWGAPSLAITAAVAIEVAMAYFNLGERTAMFLDSKDRRPNNGWIELH